MDGWTQRPDHPMSKRAAHPGEILKDELADVGVTPTELTHWFKTDPQFWMNLQAQFDLVAADREAGEAIKALPTRRVRPEGPEQPGLFRRG